MQWENCYEIVIAHRFSHSFYLSYLCCACPSTAPLSWEVPHWWRSQGKFCCELSASRVLCQEECSCHEFFFVPLGSLGIIFMCCWDTALFYSALQLHVTPTFNTPWAISVCSLFVLFGGVCPAPGSHFGWPWAICLHVCSSVTHPVSFSRPLLSCHAWLCQHSVIKLLLCKTHCTWGSSLSLLSLQKRWSFHRKRSKSKRDEAEEQMISWRNCCPSPEKHHKATGRSRKVQRRQTWEVSVHRSYTLLAKLAV